MGIGAEIGGRVVRQWLPPESGETPFARTAFHVITKGNRAGVLP